MDEFNGHAHVRFRFLARFALTNLSIFELLFFFFFNSVPMFQRDCVPFLERGEIVVEKPERGKCRLKGRNTDNSFNRITNQLLCLCSPERNTLPSFSSPGINSPLEDRNLFTRDYQGRWWTVEKVRTRNYLQTAA